MLDRDFTKREVKEWILRMKNNKASGWDGIPMEFWKGLCRGEQGVEILTNMFNKIKNRRQFPVDWKTAIIYPIYKGRGGRGIPGNYRGISLLSACSKIFSGILLQED
jgi:hypothetical protein